MSFLRIAITSLMLAGSAISASAANIVETAKGAGQFNTLLTAAKAAGLVPALTGKGPLTVFAPTDAAFAKLPKGTVESLLEPKNKKKLAAILTYHVVSGDIYADDIKTGRTHVKTLNGKSVAVRKHGGVSVNGARVVQADVKASNGVIHVIDKVLLPH
jgi:uncharacterized surface protein with fasciclin (FAS1) repeats